MIVKTKNRNNDNAAYVCTFKTKYEQRLLLYVHPREYEYGSSLPLRKLKTATCACAVPAVKEMRLTGFLTLNVLEFT